MNVWAMRNKLKSAVSGGQQTAPSARVEQAACAQQASLVSTKPACLNDLLSDDFTSTPASPEPVKAVGLNDMFDLAESDIHRISPKLTFSGLKKAVS